MKKIIYLSLILLGILVISNTKIYAAETPYYDKNFNQQAGAFYANGTDITIEEKNSQTVIKWLDQEQIVPNTVTVFGGGQKGTNFENSNITMNGGTVVAVVGGGISEEANSIAKVENANITINGGTISSNIVGGGYLYSEVTNANIIINDCVTETILGGGLATVMIDGQMKHVGDATQPENSPNRVNNTNITINNVTMPLPSHQGGIIYAGAQGYAFVGETNLTINGGSMPKTTILAGGSDDYVNKSNVTIKGGDILLYQSINRGTVNDVTTKVTGGNIQEFNVAAKSDTSPSGVLGKATIYLLDGTIEKLAPGIVKTGTLEIDKIKYKVVQATDMKITDNLISEDKRIQVDYNLSLTPQELTLAKNSSKNIDISIKTEPTGYESLFIDNVKWKSDNTNIATVSEDGLVTAVKPGNTNIIASCFKKSATAHVVVTGNSNFTVILMFLLIVFIVLLIAFITSIVFF